MKISELVPAATGKKRFHLSESKWLPMASGCYVLTTFEGDILYVGLATNLLSRCEQHLENPTKTKPTLKGKAFWIWFREWDPENLPALERAWLNLVTISDGEMPILNKVFSPIG